MTQYKIKNWAKFQHFKNRRPPWIKLHREILDQLDINMISDCSFRVLIGLWLLASEDETKTGTLPPLEDICFRLRRTKKVILESLQELNKFVLQDDITMISERYQLGSPETETETETERDYMSGKQPDVSPPNSVFRETAKGVLIFLNQKTGRHYEPVEANLGLIVARLKEGATRADCFQVIAKKTREWLPDEKMAMYLRPATLFNKTKFAQYKGELLKKESHEEAVS